MTAELYVCCDVETDGMCPGLHSMLQLGAVMLDENGNPMSTFSENLKPLPDCSPLESTMAWWAERPDIYHEVTRDQRDPQPVMREFKAWIEGFDGHKVFVGYPVTFDYSFVWYYLWRFTGGSPFPHGALDIKTLAMSLLGGTYQNSRKGNWPAAWSPPETHSHIALDDALEQAFQFRSMLRQLRG